MFVIQTGGSLIPSYDIQCPLNISQTTTMSNSENGKNSIQRPDLRFFFQILLFIPFKGAIPVNR